MRVLVIVGIALLLLLLLSQAKVKSTPYSRPNSWSSTKIKPAEDDLGYAQAKLELIVEVRGRNCN